MRKLAFVALAASALALPAAAPAQSNPSDRDGRALDTRGGLDWDEYGERWDSDAGIPHYYGRGDYRPSARDYARVDRQEVRGDVVVRDKDESHEQIEYATPYGYAYGNGYGGYGVAYPIVIETTVVTGGAPSDEEEAEPR